MGFISDFLAGVRGEGDGNPVTVAACEAELRRITDERSATNAAIASRAGRRHALLLDDASDKAIQALDREIDAHHLTLERLEAFEGIVFSRLQECRTEERNKTWKDSCERYEQRARGLAIAMRAAVEAQLDVAEIIDAARSGGFEHEATATFPTPPLHLNLEALRIFESAVDRMADTLAGRLKPPPEIQRAMPRPAPAQAPNPAAGRVSLADREERPARPARVPRVDVAQQGERLVRVLRNGLEAPDGGQCIISDVIAMEPEQAAAVVKNGAGEFCEGVA